LKRHLNDVGLTIEQCRARLSLSNDRPATADSVSTLALDVGHYIQRAEAAQPDEAITERPPRSGRE